MRNLLSCEQISTEEISEWLIPSTGINNKWSKIIKWCLQTYKQSAWPKINVEWIFFAWHKKGTKRMYVSVLVGVFEKGDNRYWFMSRPIFYSVSIQIPRHCRRIKTETWLRPFMSNLTKMSIKKPLLTQNATIPLQFWRGLVITRVKAPSLDSHLLP